MVVSQRSSKKMRPTGWMSLNEINFFELKNFKSRFPNNCRCIKINPVIFWKWNLDWFIQTQKGLTTFIVSKLFKYVRIKNHTFEIASTLTRDPKTLILSVSMGVFPIRILAFSIFLGCLTPTFLLSKNPSSKKESSRVPKILKKSLKPN